MSKNAKIGILRVFASQAERDAFYNSKALQRLKSLCFDIDGRTAYGKLTGLVSWLRPPIPPPKCKMAVATLCGVYSTNLFPTYVLGPHVQRLHPPLRILIVAGCMVGLLTWVVMPQMTKVLKPWHSEQSTGYDKIAGNALCISAHER